MSVTYVSVLLRRQVINRAGPCCEYCQLPVDQSYKTFEIDHVIAEKHGGRTELENLAFACYYCNKYKGSDLASVDPETGELVFIFHPRKDTWGSWFSNDHQAKINSGSPRGRATAQMLRFNEPDRIRERNLSY